MKKVIAVLLVMLLVLGCAACGKSESKPDAEVSETQEESVASIADCVSILEAAAKKSFGENCEVGLDGSVVTINFWEDGITSGVGLAMNGDAESLNQWNQLVENAKTMCNSARELLDSFDHNDVATLVQVVSDLDTTKAFLCVSDGVVLYDAVNGINLMGG